MLVPGIYVDDLINVDSSSPIVAHANGFPYVATGAIATGLGPITHYNQGLPFNADGRIVATVGAPTVYQVGYSFNDDGEYCIDEGLESFGLRDVDSLPNVISEDAEIGDGVGIQTLYISPNLNPVTYSITTQSTPGAFQVHPTTCVVTVATEGLLDFESRQSETVTVRATDTVTLVEIEKTFTIAVTDVVADLNEVWGADRLVWLTDSGVEPSVWRI